MDSKTDVLEGYAERLKNEGIGMSGAVIALKLHPDKFAMSGEDVVERQLDRDALRKEAPFIYELFARSKDISAIMCTRPRFCVEAANRGRDIPRVLTIWPRLSASKRRYVTFQIPPK